MFCWSIPSRAVASEVRATALLFRKAASQSARSAHRSCESVRRRGQSCRVSSRGLNLVTDASCSRHRIRWVWGPLVRAKPFEHEGTHLKIRQMSTARGSGDHRSGPSPLFVRAPPLVFGRWVRGPLVRAKPINVRAPTCDATLVRQGGLGTVGPGQAHHL